MNGSSFAGSGFALTASRKRSRQYVTCEHIGCSTHGVPSWSKVAIRSAGSTRLGPPRVVVVCTNSTIAFFAAPSFHVGSGSVCAPTCAGQCDGEDEHTGKHRRHNRLHATPIPRLKRGARGARARDGLRSLSGTAPAESRAALRSEERRAPHAGAPAFATSRLFTRLFARVAGRLGLLHCLDDLIEVVARWGLKRRELLVGHQFLHPQHLPDG